MNAADEQTLLDAMMDAQDTDAWWLEDAIRFRLEAIGIDPDMTVSELNRRLGL